MLIEQAHVTPQELNKHKRKEISLQTEQVEEPFSEELQRYLNTMSIIPEMQRT